MNPLLRQLASEEPSSRGPKSHCHCRLARFTLALPEHAIRLFMDSFKHSSQDELFSSSNTDISTETTQNYTQDKKFNLEVKAYQKLP
jgi:hypothetical protein